MLKSPVRVYISSEPHPPRSCCERFTRIKHVDALVCKTSFLAFTRLWCAHGETGLARYVLLLLNCRCSTDHGVLLLLLLFILLQIYTLIPRGRFDIAYFEAGAEKETVVKGASSGELRLPAGKGGVWPPPPEEEVLPPPPPPPPQDENTGLGGWQTVRKK